MTISAQTSHNKQQGFTLLEIMVVVVIIAVVSGISVLALVQADQRRYNAEADRLLVWLQTLSEMAVLEGTAYGLLQVEGALQSVVYFNNEWYRSSSPDVFNLLGNARLDLREEGARIQFQSPGAQEDEQLVPDLVMLPDGFIEPGSVMQLAWEGQEPVYLYEWDDSLSRFEMSRVK